MDTSIYIVTPKTKLDSVDFATASFPIDSSSLDTPLYTNQAKWKIGEGWSRVVAFFLDPLYLHNLCLPDGEQLADEVVKSEVEGDKGGCEPDSPDDPRQQALLDDDDYADYVESHVKQHEDNNEEDILRFQVI